MKKAIYIYIAIISVYFKVAEAQISFVKTFPGCSLGADVSQTTDGGYIMAGENDSDYFTLTKTNQFGEIVWNTTYGQQYSYAYSVQQTNDGGYVAVGHNENSSSHRNVYLIKTDAVGTLLWSKEFGANLDQDYGKFVRQTTDGGYIIAGYTDKNDLLDIYLIKTDSNGVELWIRVLEGPNTDFASCVQQTADGGYIIGGGTGLYGDYNSLLIKTDMNGDTLWTKTFADYGMNAKEGNLVQQTTDGGYIMGSADIIFGDQALIKTNSNGDIIWTKTYPYAEEPEGVQQTIDDGYIVVGHTNSFGGYSNIFVMKTDYNGDSLWTWHCGDSNYQYGLSVQQTNDNGYILTGHVCNFPDFSTYLIKMDPNGVVISTFYADADDDGYGSKTDSILTCLPPPMYVANTMDCDDANAAINPSVPETANGIDDDCDGIIDETCAASFSLVADALTPHHYWAINMATGISPVSYYWTWGDGSFDTTAYPSHTYNTSGFYTICMSVADYTGCNDTSCFDYDLLKMTDEAKLNSVIQVDVVADIPTQATNEARPIRMIFFPNPVQQKLIVRLDGLNESNSNVFTIVVRDAYGRSMERAHSFTGTQTEVNTGEFPAGFYTIELIDKKTNERWRRKFIRGT